MDYLKGVKLSLLILELVVTTWICGVTNFFYFILPFSGDVHS